MEIELRHLRLIRALGETGSVSRAAATLGASQPAVSRQLTRIEHAMGARLFQRGRGGVEHAASVPTISAVRRTRRSLGFMGLILLEALLALAVLVLIVWWTMFSGRRRGEPPRAVDTEEREP